ncbi:MAG: HAD family hydrolase [Thermomicrobiales bacterium]|nr:HAD family hydrolase [Thermomicrobiales bacterium]
MAPGADGLHDRCSAPSGRNAISRESRRPYDLILFDLDGTLTDSAPGITRSVQFALARFGIAVADPEELTPFVGPPLAESFRRYYGFDDDQARQAIAAYRERFATVGLFENAVYSGIPELLAALRETGVTLAIASSKPEPYVIQILEHFGLAGHFAAVAGSNLDLSRVAKAGVIAHALATLPAVDTGRIVMVGDREHDVIGARTHGIATIAAGYGYGTRQELAAANPLAIAESVAALGEILLARSAATVTDSRSPGRRTPGTRR